MSDPKEFLSRWSRRKREADQAAPGEPESIAEPGISEPPLPVPALPIPELPPIDTLTVASDFKPFLQAGVPESLKLAALRRLWSIDPEIRDFVGPARDYGWDWNTPGGVPGSGPLPSADEIAKAVERIFGVADPPAASRETSKSSQSNTLDEDSPSLRPQPGALPKLRDVELPSEPPEPIVGQDIKQIGATKRRHGSATPS